MGFQMAAPKVTEKKEQNNMATTNGHEIIQPQHQQPAKKPNQPNAKKSTAQIAQKRAGATCEYIAS